MNYTVVWKPAAEDALAELWASSFDRQAFTDAVNEVERLLGDAPLLLGESRSENRRIYFHRPVVVTFDVSDADRMVYILRVNDLSQ